MKQSAKTIFRVVGGYSNRHTLIKYEIVPYLLLSETPRYWTVSRNGRTEIQQKRTTSNTDWFEDVESALRCILQRIDVARSSIADTMEQIQHHEFRSSWQTKVYVVRFAYEIFHFYEYNVRSETRKGFKVEGKAYNGMEYIYPKPNQPHNPATPFEIFISKDANSLLGAVRMYGEDRLRYLHTTKQKMIDWVRLFERERYGQENG